MKMTLKHAIEEKAKITRDLKRYNDLMQTYNCKSDHAYNIHDLFNRIKIGNQNLEQLKILILDANHKAGMYEQIYALRSLTTELDNLQALLRKIDDDNKPLMSKEELRKEIRDREDDTKDLKKQLDEFNFNTTIEYSPK